MSPNPQLEIIAKQVLLSEGVDLKTVSKFTHWLRENPLVFEKFKIYTLKAIHRGVTLGAKAIGERVRYETAIETRGDFKCNNNFWAYSARLFEAIAPRHEGYFKKRSLKGLK